MLQFLFWLSQQLNLVFIIAISVLVVGIIGQRSIYQIQRQIRIRKEAEEKMRLYAKDIEIAKIEIEKQKDQLDSIVSSMGEGLLVCDDKKRCILVNQMAGSLLRSTPSDLAGKPVQECVSFFQANDKEGRQSQFVGLLEEAMTGPDIITKAAVDHFFCQGPDDHCTAFPVALVIAPLLKKGKSAGTITLFRDSTREERIDEMKSEFVSVASHQLRTPLTVINWNLEMLLEEKTEKLSTRQEQYIKDVYKESQRMVALVNDLLNVSRLQSGRVKIEPVATDLEDFIEDIISAYRPLLSQSKRAFIFKRPKRRLPAVPVDRILFRQVIDNFITNAIRYSPADKNSTVTVALAKMKDGYQVSVTDEGIGIPLADQEHIFEKLFRSDNARLAASDGSGLGLYISRMIMDSGGCKLWFESKEGHGSTFYALLPVTGMREKSGEKKLAGSKVE